MKIALLVIIVLGIFIYGYYLVNNLDKFLDHNRKNTKCSFEREYPSCVMFTDRLSDDEIIKEIDYFRKNHKEIKIILFTNNDSSK